MTWISGSKKHCRTWKHIGLVGMMILALCIPIFPYVSYPVAATDYTYCTNQPTAWNSSYWYEVIGIPSSPTVLFEATRSEDGYIEDLYYPKNPLLPLPVTRFIETNDWNEIGLLYCDPVPVVGGIPTPDLPPDNGTATILGVYVSYRFDFLCPDAYFRVSVNNKASWHTSSLYPGGSWGTQYWNVTSLESWTPALLRTSQVWVQLEADIALGIHYYLDYVGINIRWSVPYYISGFELPEGDGGDEEDGEGTPTDYDSFFVSTNIVGLLGFVGLIGVIATPALAVYAYRNGDEGRIVLGIKMFAAFMIFLSLFLVSIS